MRSFGLQTDNREKKINPPPIPFPQQSCGVFADWYRGVDLHNKTMNEDVTQIELMELYHYDPRTGNFTRRKRIRGSRRGGTVAGSRDGRGYLRIWIRSKIYKAHRLAWLYIYGEWPNGALDHINQIPGDNRICNLREATHSQNQQNIHHIRKSRSGLIGVFPDKRGWLAHITKNGKRFRIGIFRDKEMAFEAYIKAKRRLHEFGTL